MYFDYFSSCTFSIFLQLTQRAMDMKSIFVVCFTNIFLQFIFSVFCVYFCIEVLNSYKVKRVCVFIFCFPSWSCEKSVSTLTLSSCVFMVSPFTWLEGGSGTG